MIPVDQFLDLPFGFLHLVLRGGRINHLGIQDLSGRIHNRQLTTGAEGGIPSKHRFACNRGLHQKLRQIFPKNGNGAVLRLLRQFVADIPLDGRSNQPFIRIDTRLFQDLRRLRRRLRDQLLLQIG